MARLFGREIEYEAHHALPRKQAAGTRLRGDLFTSKRPDVAREVGLRIEQCGILGLGNQGARAMPEGLFDDAYIVISCPSCGDHTPKTLRWHKASTEFGCPNCGIGVDIDGVEVRTALDRVEKSLLELDRAVTRAFDKPKEYP
jgi:hypothetical protein